MEDSIGRNVSIKFRLTFRNNIWVVQLNVRLELRPLSGALETVAILRNNF